MQRHFGRHLGKLAAKKSIMQKKDGHCYLCMKLNNDYRTHVVLHEHHVFGGTANRKISEREGLKVYLCPEHHVIGPDAVHNNSSLMRMLQRDGQKVYEKSHSREDFLKTFGRLYI